MRPMRLGVWLCLLLSLPAAASNWSRRHPLRSPESRHLRLKAVDFYRSETLTVDAVQGKLGNQINSFAGLRQGGRKAQAQAAKVKAEIEAELRKMAPLAYADVFYADYVTSAEEASYITVDVVDRKDAKARMPFSPPPIGRPSDPHGLLQAWRSYAALGK